MKKQDVMKAANSATTQKSTPFYIVGIGASAGGLKALELFFSNVPVKSGLAFVVVQHFDPTFDNILPELLQKITTIPVVSITNLLEIESNYIYIIPSNKYVAINNGYLVLSLPKVKRGFRLPIDFFFKSLALNQLSQSIGVILSGMGSDGSSGCKAIIENQGLVFVQVPTSAKFPEMPQNAILASIPFYVGSPEDLANSIIKKFSSSDNNVKSVQIDNKEKELDQIVYLLQEQSGHDFTLYKKSTLLRRIERRKGIHQIETTLEYESFLEQNPKEVEILFNELLIGVTRFFRDELVWERLGNIVLPELLKHLPDGHILRAWIPACSTGEEAFSLAIIFQEVIAKTASKQNCTLQLFATDLDADAITKARKGLYNINSLETVSQERIQNFFTPESNGFKISKTIRSMIVFATHNVTKDPPFTKLNLLFCRNMLIYMEPVLQKQLMELFYYSLVPNGILLLGSAETVANSDKVFEVIDSKLKFYKKPTNSSSSSINQFPNAFTNQNKMKSKEQKAMQLSENIQSSADQILIQQFAPPSVLVNENGDIVYITGKTGKYLEPVAGKSNWNIYTMAHDEIKNKLPESFALAIKSYEPICIENIEFNYQGNIDFVTLIIQQMESPEIIKGLFLILFANVEDKLQEPYLDTKTALIQSGKEGVDHSRIYYQEIQKLKEEMKTSQEELQSINEELQSKNEELTTSKEETQSLNEELQTVNTELQTKIVDFESGIDTMKNLLNSTGIAVLFVDNELNIRQFTESVTQIFKLRTSDIGRPYTDLATDLIYPEMKEDALHVVVDKNSIQKTIDTHDSRCYLIKINPYQTGEIQIDGLVITFTEITLI